MAKRPKKRRRSAAARRRFTVRVRKTLRKARREGRLHGPRLYGELTSRQKRRRRRVSKGGRTRLKKTYSPGSLLYFGGAVHEVLRDGRTCRVRRDLVPGSPKRLWRPKWTKLYNSRGKLVR